MCERKTESYLSAFYNVESPASYQQERGFTVQEKTHLENINILVHQGCAWKPESHVVLSYFCQ